MFKRFSIGAIAALVSALGAAQQISPTVDISIYGLSVYSHGTVWHECTDPVFSCAFTGYHNITDGATGSNAAQTTFNITHTGSGTYYDQTINAGTAYSHCYQANVSATGYGGSQRVSSGTKCAPDPPSTGGGDGDVLSACDLDNSCAEPLLLNLDDGPYRLSNADDPVSFDIHADGRPVRMSWTARDARMAFLALDRNGNGTIDDGAELFGNASPLQNGARARNGFDALMQYDDNADRVIDASDRIWSSLLLWTDLNHDGVAQSSEIVPVSQSPVAAIGLDYHWTGRRDSSGNTFRYEGRAWLPTPRPLYDVFFVVAP